MNVASRASRNYYHVLLSLHDLSHSSCHALPIVYIPCMSIPISDYSWPLPFGMKIGLDKNDVARSNLLTIRSQMS